MQQRVNPGNKSLADYRSIVRRELYDEVVSLGERLKGKRVLHVSATSFGGGVAEILYTLVPLMRDVGLDAEWDIMFGSEPFFNVTKSFHNALQGAEYELTVEDRAIFEEYNRISAEAMQKADEEWDIVLVHDPQPCLIKYFSGGLSPETKWIWRCHPDLSTPNREVLDYLVPHIADYDAQIYTMQEYTPPDVHLPGLTLIPPAIDPLSPKNMALSADDSRYIVNQFGVDVDRPFMVQVSRFDPWKDPLGVIDAYRLVKEQIPEVQLVLIGSMAHDDPEGWDYWYKTVNYADGDRTSSLFSNLTNVGAIEVNAFQSIADVVIQKSIREGFGLVVSEALWKARPLVAARVAASPCRWTVGAASSYTIPRGGRRLREDSEGRPEFARHIGRLGKEHVRDNYLSPRELRDHLLLFAKLLGV